jgi:hypothetical protein
MLKWGKEPRSRRLHGSPHDAPKRNGSRSRIRLEQKKFMKSENLYAVEFIKFLNARKGWHGNQYRTACGQWLAGKIKENPAETTRFWKPAFHEGANLHCCDTAKADRAICGIEINTPTVIPMPKYAECCWDCIAKLTGINRP